MEVVHARCAGLDISKTDAKVCVRIAGRGPTKTSTTVTTWSATSSVILGLADMLAEQKVTCVVMEATGDYWKPFYSSLAGGRAAGDAGQRRPGSSDPGP